MAMQNAERNAMVVSKTVASADKQAEMMEQVDRLFRKLGSL
jgi:hypothetical protein